MKIMVTGGAGFIGSAVIRHLLNSTDHDVVNIDRLSYAGHLESLEKVSSSGRYHFERKDICDAEGMRCIFEQYEPDAVMHLAAESHVDRSIDGPWEFVRTNILGTYTLLEESVRYRAKKKGGFLFHHVSTDEVFGSLGSSGNFTEESPYQPRSPYSASKASADHLVKAWHHTYHLPVVITNCSNNFGPYQYPEKLIPLTILKALRGEPIPVYGRGENVRDWLFVEDHARALLLALEKGRVGETYNIGAHNERKNIDVVRLLCRFLDDILGCSRDHGSLIHFVQDRPGHDYRYAMDSHKIETELDWKPQTDFELALKKTVKWYIENRDWCELVMKGSYVGERLGVVENRVEA